MQQSTIVYPYNPPHKMSHQYPNGPTGPGAYPPHHQHQQQHQQRGNIGPPHHTTGGPSQSPRHWPNVPSPPQRPMSGPMMSGPNGMPLALGTIGGSHSYPPPPSQQQQQQVAGLRSLEAASGAELPGPLERAIARAHTTVQAQAASAGLAENHQAYLLHHRQQQQQQQQQQREAEAHHARREAAYHAAATAVANQHQQHVVAANDLSNVVRHHGGASSLLLSPSDIQIRMASSDGATSSAKASKMTSGGGGGGTNTKPRYKKRTKKYNNFNIFFMLERQLLLQSRGGGIDAIANPVDTSDSPMTKHKELHLPPLCRRYNHLPLTSNWFLELLASQNKKRPHRKSHGLIPFKELAQTVAKNYREIDDETQSFVNEVAERLGWHCEEIEVAAEKERQEEEEELERSRPQLAHNSASGGVHNGARSVLNGGKKRKDPPVVSGGKKSPDEVDAVQQLMGMKANSPSDAVGAPGGTLHPGQGHPGNHTSTFPPHHAVHQGCHPSQVPSHNMAHGGPRGGPHPSAHHTLHPAAPPMRDVESDHLQIELARAMNARLESERRIHLLKDQMTVHCAQKYAAAAAAGGGAAHGGAHPGAHPSQVHSAHGAHPSAHAGSHHGAHPNHGAHPSSHGAHAHAGSHHGAHPSHPSNHPQAAHSARSSGGYPGQSLANSIPPSVLKNLPAGYEQYLSMMLAGDRVAAERAIAVDQLVAERNMAERAVAERAAMDKAMADVAADRAAVERAAANHAKQQGGSNSKPASPDASSKRPLHPTTIASLSPNATLEDVERALLKEAILRGMIPPSPAPGAPPARPNSAGAAPARPGSANAAVGTPRTMALQAFGYPPSMLRGLPLAAMNNKEEPLKKRARYSPNNEGESKEQDADGEKRASSEERPRPASSDVSGSDIGFYKDLYSKLAGAGRDPRDTIAALSREMGRDLGRDLGRDPLAAMAAARAAREAEAARDPTAAAAAARDLALFDSLLARNSAEQAAAQHSIFDSLAARGGHGPPPSSHGAPPSHHYPSAAAHYPPPPPSHAAPPSTSVHGLHGYSSLLSQLAAQNHQRPSSGAHHGTPSPHPPGGHAAASHLAAARDAAVSRGANSASPPKPNLLEMVHAASRSSQFGLSYNDIMGVWKEMNRERANAPAGAQGEGGNTKMEEEPKE